MTNVYKKATLKTALGNSRCGGIDRFRCKYKDVALKIKYKETDSKCGGMDVMWQIVL